MSKSEELVREYNDLLLYLNDRLVENSRTDIRYDRVMLIASSHLSDKALSSKAFLDVCNRLKVVGKLGVDNLRILKEMFSKDVDHDAYKRILRTESQIKGE